MKFHSFDLLLFRCICFYTPTNTKIGKEIWTTLTQTITAAMITHRRALLLSSSNCHGYSMLEFAKQDICSFLQKKDVKEILFVPYAQNNYDGYTSKIKDVLDPWGFKVSGLHTHADPADAIMNAKAIFIGGGNTFLLLSRLCENNLVSLIRERVNLGQLSYIGSSAGTNVATRTINTTNDMPIVYPPTFDAINIVPFNINPHYIEVENPTHMGETRDQRIWEYLEMDHATSVLGLREGAILDVDENKLSIKGVAGAVLFTKNHKKIHYPSGSDVSFLLNINQIKETLQTNM